MAPAPAHAKRKAAPKKPAPKKPTAPKRVRLRNTRAGNGMIGAIATPLEKDAAAWLERGWVRD